MSASRSLANGAGVHDAFLSLLRDGASPDDAAIAVCVAAGSTHEEAVERLREFTGLWDLCAPGEEADAVDLLIAHGYFEADAVLDDRQQEALTHLKAAIKAVPGIPSGFGNSLWTSLRTGRLSDAYHQLESLGSQRWRDNTRFWTALHRARDAGIFGDDLHHRAITDTTRSSPPSQPR